MAAVEAIGELSQIARAVLAVLDAVIGCIQGHLHIAQHDVDPAQRRMLRRLPPTTSDMPLMPGANGLHLGKAVGAIGYHTGLRPQRYSGPLLDDLVGKASHRRQTHALRALLLIGLHGRHEGRLVQRTSPTVDMASTLATQIGVIDLHASGKRSRLIAQAHRLQQLVLEQPSAVVANAQMALERQSADAVFVLGEQIQRQEPLGQRQAGVLQDGASGDRALIVAAGALPQPAGVAVLSRPILRAIAARAAPALGPAGSDQCLLTLLLTAIALHEF